MNKTKILLLAITGMMATAFTACQSDDIDSAAGGDANANVYNVTADVDAAQDNQPGSRVLALTLQIRRYCTLHGLQVTS